MVYLDKEYVMSEKTIEDYLDSYNRFLNSKDR